MTVDGVIQGLGRSVEGGVDGAVLGGLSSEGEIVIGEEVFWECLIVFDEGGFYLRFCRSDSDV